MNRYKLFWSKDKQVKVKVDRGYLKDAVLLDAFLDGFNKGFDACREKIKSEEKGGE